MLVVIIADGEDAKEIADLIYAAQKDKYVRFNFCDAKSAVKDVIGSLRPPSHKKYNPFIKIVNTIVKSGVRVLVDDCNSKERLSALRSLDSRVVHVGTHRWHIDGDLYFDHKPTSIRDITNFIDEIDQFVSKSNNTLYRGDGWVLKNV